MKLASLAFFLAVALAGMLVLASLLGYDPQSIGSYIAKLGEPAEPTYAPSVEAPMHRQQTIGGEANQIDPNAFHGPTGKPSIKGPAGPPPQE